MFIQRVQNNLLWRFHSSLCQRCKGANSASPKQWYNFIVAYWYNAFETRIVFLVSFDVFLAFSGEYSVPDQCKQSGDEGGVLWGGGLQWGGGYEIIRCYSFNVSVWTFIHDAAGCHPGYWGRAYDSSNPSTVSNIISLHTHYHKPRHGITNTRRQHTLVRTHLGKASTNIGYRHTHIIR